MAAEDAEPMDVEGAAPLPIICLQLLHLIKTEQAQNGVLHSDYDRYRHHCGSKLKSLAKVLNFQHGRTKFQKRRIEATTVVDPRFLHIIVFNAERAWGYAMQMKKENEKAMSLPRRNHLVRRLRKAAFWASELVRIASERGDARTQLEAQAYAAWMHGHLLLEKESDWTTALSKFTRARMLFGQLAKVVPLDQQTLFLQMVEDIEPSTRFCEYQMGRKGTAVPSEVQLLVASDAQGQAGINALKAQIDALAQEAQQHPADSTSFLEWQGRKYPVRADRVRACLHQAQEYGAKLAAGAAGGVASSSAADGAAVLALYTRMINSYNEAKCHVRNTLKASSAAEGDPQYQELTSLEMAVQGSVLERAVERGRLLVSEAEQRFAAGMERVALGKRAREKDKYARAEDVVRLLEALSRSLGELGELGTRLGGRPGEALLDRCGAAASQVQARRCYYVAQALLSGGKPLEAYALFGRAAERVAEAKQRLAELPGPPDAQLLAELQRVTDGVTAFRAVAHAEHSAEGLKGQEAVQQGLGSIALAEQAAAPGQGHGHLLDHLDVWESFAGHAGLKAPRLFKAPFPMQSIPMRPIMLDTASNFVDYPSLEHRVRKQAPKSMLSSIFGGWGAKK